MMLTTVSFTNVSVLRRYLLPLFLISIWHGAFAAADSTPTDWLPQFNKVRFEGPDVVFDAGVTRIRLRGGKWSQASGSPIDTLAEKRTGFVPRNAGCTVPREVLSRYKNEYKPTEVIYCELPERIWFATGGYCGEGDDDPGYNQGSLYSYSPKTGQVRDYPGFLPKCAELAGLERIDHQLVLVTVYQEEYSLQSGQVLIYDMDHLKAPPKELTDLHPTGAVVGMSHYDKQCDCLWFATLEGLERLTLRTGKWERRYLDYEISPDNKFLPALSIVKPGAEKMWLGRVLYRYPIEDVRGFVSAWNHSPPTEYDRPRIGPLLLPFYISATERTNEGWSDWHFQELMDTVAAHQDRGSRATVRAFIEKLLRQPMNLSRRKVVISSAKKFGIADADKLDDEYFHALLNDYFIRPRANNSGTNDVVDISFRHPEYLPRLRDYYLTHVMTFDVEDAFLVRVNQYRIWPGYEVMAPAVEKGLKRYEYRQGLLRKCAEFRYSQEQDPARAKNELITILQARLETDTQAEFMNDPVNGSTRCIDASRYWIHGRDRAEFRARTDLMVDVAETNKKFVPMILEILNFRFATNYTNLDDWKRWWASTPGTGANDKPVTPEPPAASKVPVVSVASPYTFRKYHVHYDVNADGAYSELDEMVMNVDTEMGVRFAKMFPLGMPTAGLKIGKRDVEVLTAYTLKKNGQRTEAIRLNSQDKNIQATPDPMMKQAFAQARVVAFQDVAVGDSLVFSYRVIQKESPSPGNIALTRTIPMFSVHDGVRISLSAPASLNLYADVTGIEAAKVSEADGIRNWMWTFRNGKDDAGTAGKPAVPQAFSVIHISSFKDRDAERNAMMVIPAASQDRFARWKKDAEAGNADAQLKIAGAYRYGGEASKDVVKAIEWYQKASAQGQSYASRSLGDIYMYGQGVNKDIVKAADWYQKSFEQGGDVPPSLETRLGLMFEKGKEIPKDMSKAAEWYRRAAIQDYGLAEFYLSLMYENGEGVAKDAANAKAWFEKAAAHGWEGKDDLNVYTTLSPDRRKSVEWFRRGAERGNADAQFRLGEIYEIWMNDIYGYGSGVDNDYDKAFKWYHKAAEQGNVRAQYRLGRMYQRGKGIAADAGKAIEWYQKAAAHADDQLQKIIRKSVVETYAQGEVPTRNGAASAGLSPDYDIRLITATRIGPVSLGMRLEDARKVLPAAKFERTTDGEGLALVAVELGDEQFMVLYAGEVNANSPINWSKRIENIETFDPRCHTAGGVHPYSRVRDVEKVFGKITQIMVSEIESREFVDFEKQPKYFLIRSDYIGIFPADNTRRTTKFKPDGRIMSIAISSS
ncbi:MAG: DUF3857 domain-containing protein [Gallionella sp.]